MNGYPDTGAAGRRKLLFRLRHHAIHSAWRVAWWRLQGMHIGPRTTLSRIHVTWPHTVELGARCCIENGVVFKFDGPYCHGRHIVIGDEVFAGHNVEFNIKDSIRVGNQTLIASGCRFIDHNHGTAADMPMRIQQGTMGAIRIGSDCWIGANVVVLQGVEIGDGATVGAGAVVTKSIPAGDIWAGVPARRVGQRNKSFGSDPRLFTEPMDAIQSQGP